MISIGRNEVLLLLFLQKIQSLNMNEIINIVYNLLGYVLNDDLSYSTEKWLEPRPLLRGSIQIYPMTIRVKGGGGGGEGSRIKQIVRNTVLGPVFELKTLSYRRPIL